jgi:hypothetical protein
VVTGAAAARDAPLAQWLRDEIDRRGGGVTYRRAVVMDDQQYVRTPGVHQNPMIAIGGPGANGVVQHLSTQLPMVWSREDRTFIQMSLDERVRQAALWGMDAAATREAVEAFVEHGLLDALLDRAWVIRVQHTV